MSGLPFDLADESALDARSIEALNSVSGHAAGILETMPENWSDPDIDAAFNHILPVIDGDYLAYHRVRLETENAPMTIFSYIAFLGDADELRSKGYEVMDEMPSYIDFEIRNGVLVNHMICPLKMLHAHLFQEIVQDDWKTAIRGERCTYKLSDANDQNPLSEFENNLMIEVIH